MLSKKNKQYNKLLSGLYMGFAWLFAGYVLWVKKDTLVDYKMFLLITPIIISASYISFYSYKLIKLHRSQRSKVRD